MIPPYFIFSVSHIYKTYELINHALTLFMDIGLNWSSSEFIFYQNLLPLCVFYYFIKMELVLPWYDRQNKAHSSESIQDLRLKKELANNKPVLSLYWQDNKAATQKNDFRRINLAFVWSLQIKLFHSNFNLSTNCYQL